MTVRGLGFISVVGTLCGILVAGSLAQGPPNERVFPQPKAAVEKAVKAVAASGRLPALEGFAQPGDHPLDHYQKGFYQCSALVTAERSGGTRLRVTAKITAWYSDPTSGQSGYQVLPSNGRLETDFLDRVQEALGAASSTRPNANAAAADQGSNKQAAHAAASERPGNPGPSIQAPAPGGSVLADAIAASHTPWKSAGALPSAPLPTGDVNSIRTQKAVLDRHAEELNKEAQSLEEILRNRAQPSNLAAVKRSGTPVLMSPNEGARELFLAEAEDEFEILDMNANWVHVRISGPARGWIRRNNLELPANLAAETHAVPAAPTEMQPAASAAGPGFQIENEQIASFPGEWEPLRNKTVKIISVQRSSATASSARAKLDFAKSLLQRKYAELAAGTAGAGVVIVFDSEDGGMMAATLPVLQQWVAGSLSDEALWRRCFFDPPEAFQLSAKP